MKFTNAYSGRGGGRLSTLLHASPSPPEPISRTGGTYRAACGTQVRNVTNVPWDPYKPGRHCRACTLAVRS